MRLPRATRALCLAATCLTGLAVVPALAQAQAPATPPAASGTAAAPAPAAPAAPPPGFWVDGIHLSAQIEGGFTINPANPSDGVNYGRLFDDRANQPQFNQLLLTATKPLNSSATGFDWGFKLQGLYGSDARYTHYLGVFDQNPGPGYENQFDIIEAAVLLHLPFPTAGGLDLTVGAYPTPLGDEVIDPSGNPFYSHSYIFNFGLPLKHTGALATAHINPTLDLWFGLDTGVNTTFVNKVGDDNGEPGGIIGFGLNNLMGGNLTILALSHIGPENATLGLSPLGYNANSYLRYLNDIVITYKASDKLTLTTELNWIRDDFDGIYTKGHPAPANAFGVAQYFSYTLSDIETLNVRAEVYRDDNGFFVAAFPSNAIYGNNAFVRGELGLPTASAGVGGVPTTYGEFTVGMTIKPNLPAPVTGLMIRPELRVDGALQGGHPFGTHSNTNAQVTLASDFVLTF